VTGLRRRLADVEPGALTLNGYRRIVAGGSDVTTSVSPPAARGLESPVSSGSSPRPPVNPPRPEWHRRALCRGAPVDLFFPTEYAGVEPEVVALCRECPVRAECPGRRADGARRGVGRQVARPEGE
jgi:Transcription factor WhiB